MHMRAAYAQQMLYVSTGTMCRFPQRTTRPARRRASRWQVRDAAQSQIKLYCCRMDTFALSGRAEFTKISPRHFCHAYILMAMYIPGGPMTEIGGWCLAEQRPSCSCCRQTTWKESASPSSVKRGRGLARTRPPGSGCSSRLAKSDGSRRCTVQ